MNFKGVYLLQALSLFIFSSCMGVAPGGGIAPKNTGISSSAAGSSGALPAGAANNSISNVSELNSAVGSSGGASNTIFSDNIGTGWQLNTWKWGSSSASLSTAQKYSGTTAIYAQEQSAWSGVTFDSLTSSGNIQSLLSNDLEFLSFYINPGNSVSALHNNLQVLLVDSVLNIQGPYLNIASYISGGFKANTWSLVKIPKSALMASTMNFNQIVFFNNNSVATTVSFYLDEIQLLRTVVAPTPTPAPAVALSTVTAPTGGVAFNINTNLNVKNISPFIYGVNDTMAHRLRGVALYPNATFYRIGGNRSTTYNWENNASNAGIDWGPNISDGFWGGGSVAGEAVKVFMNEAFNKNAAGLVTVPIVPYVAANKNNVALTVAAVSDSANWKKNLARRPSTSTVAVGATSDAYVYQNEFVKFLEGQFAPLRTSSKTLFYSLDNEPGLWADSHPLIYPSKVTYSDLLARTIDYGKMIKENAPANALVFGGVAFGYYEYVTLADAPDAPQKGDWFNYLLTNMKAEEVKLGKRILDVLDIHFYSEARSADGLPVGIGGDPATFANSSVVTARLQAPRSLWDASYKENSWIANDYLNGPIKLIPNLLSKINQYYPGTKLAITEYSYGGENHISGAIAQADALGIFGREGVFAANYFELNEGPYPYGAFDLYLNYDGVGGKVGDLSVSASSTDYNKSSIYAFAKSGDNASVYVLAINKTGNALPTNIGVSHSLNLATGSVYQLKNGNSKPVASGNITLSGNKFSYSLPAYSISTFILKAGVAPVPPAPTPTPTPTPTPAPVPSVSYDGVFSDATVGGWNLNGWGWGSSAVVEPVNQTSPRWLKVTMNQAWGGFVFALVDSNGSASMLNPQDYAAIKFDISPGASLLPAHASLQASLNNDSTVSSPESVFIKNYVNTPMAVNTWSSVRIPLNVINSKNLPFHKIVIFNNSSSSAFSFLIDNVVLERKNSTPSVALGTAVAGVSGCQNLVKNAAFMVRTYTTDQYVWYDSRCKKRTAALVRSDSKGGHAKQFSYLLDDNSLRTIDENGNAGGFGYIVSHLRNASIASGNDSPLGSNLAASYKTVFQGAHHAIHEFKMNYPRWGKDASGVNTKYNMPVTIHWFFVTGRDHPLWSVTMDLSQAPDGAVDADYRAPYGDMLFDGGNDIIGGIKWGSRYRFSTVGADPYTLNSEWDWSELNGGPPYNALWTFHTDAQMGLVGTRTMKNMDAGGYEGTDAGPFHLRSFSSYDVTKRCSSYNYKMPCDWTWPFQSINYSISSQTPNSNTNSKRLAWGSDWGSLGKSSELTVNGKTVSGWPKVSYATYIVLGPHSKDPTTEVSKQIEAIESTILTATVGSVKTSGAAGVSRNDTQLYSPIGYNPYYSTWEVDAANNAVSLNFLVGANLQLVNPTIVISNYTGTNVPSTIKLNGVVLSLGRDFFVSLDGLNKKIWLTLNYKLAGNNQLFVNP